MRLEHCGYTIPLRLQNRPIKAKLFSRCCELKFFQRGPARYRKGYGEDLAARGVSPLPARARVLVRHPVVGARHDGTMEAMSSIDGVQSPLLAMRTL